MKVDVSTPLGCSAEAAWNEVQKTSLLRHVIRPLARVTAVDPSGFPERWREGMTFRCRTYIFGFIPIGVRTLRFRRIDAVAREIVISESDPLVRRWDHTISIAPAGARRSIYRDVIDLDAGALTLVVWAWTSWFYRHRQRRWRALAPTLGSTDPP
jgi:hypothetical protein